MKKKLKDLTVAEIGKICAAVDIKCSTCPFKGRNGCPSILNLVEDEDDEREIEVPGNDKELKTNIGEIEPSGNDLINKAFERIKNAPASYREETPRFTHTYLQDLSLIETELKETDKLRQINCELLEQKDALREERDKYKKAVDMLKGNISLEFIQYPGDKYEVWLNRGYEEPVLITNTKEGYDLLVEVLKWIIQKFKI